MQSKFRNTKQLSVILDVLRTAKTPVSVATILAAAQQKTPTINKTTIYRTLEKLISEGTVEAIMVQEGTLHYEIRSPKGQHHHFLCLECKEIYCIAACACDFSSLVPRGFSLQSHELTLKGVCKNCL